jgi:hypothetical protein
LTGFTIGGFFGYGSKDYEWKYGGEIIYALNRRKDFAVGGKNTRIIWLKRAITATSTL